MSSQNPSGHTPVSPQQQPRSPCLHSSRQNLRSKPLRSNLLFRNSDWLSVSVASIPNGIPSVFFLVFKEANKFDRWCFQSVAKWQTDCVVQQSCTVGRLGSMKVL